jgi:hypothetical protein
MMSDPPEGALEPVNDGRWMKCMVPGSYALPYTLLDTASNVFSSPLRRTWIFVMEFGSGIGEMRK